MRHSTISLASSRICRFPGWSPSRIVPRVVAWVACLFPATVLAANFTVTPVNLTFGNVFVGATSSIPVTITNVSGVSRTPNFSGGAPLDPTNFGGSQNCAGVALPPGGTCRFTYEFHPTTVGPKSSSTTIGIDSDNFAITMSGTGISPVTVAPLNLAFGNVPIGSTSSIAVTITNVSGVPQTPSYSGGAPLDATNFGGSQNCAGITLAPGQNCRFTYQFHPTTLGAKSSSTTIGINDENFAITMSGTGVSPFSVAPLNLAFGNVPVGGSSSIVVTIINRSAVPRTPSFAGGAPLDPVNFGGSQNCAGVTLIPGFSCRFTYEFHPTTLGPKSSSTTISIDGENFAITMSGNASAFTVAPLNLAFGNVPVGGSSSIAVTITNVSAVAQTPSFSGGAPLDSTNFGASQNCAGRTLAPGQNCRVTYTFHPTTSGPKSSSTTIGIDTENYAITMSGTGQAPVPVDVIEFYNATLDHYFITYVPQEISDLDTGVHRGWTRTGKTFKTFTEPQPGTSPVCRFYIPPGLGDSHFFGRGTTECDDTARRFPQLILEDGAFMHMFLPTNGVCPAGTVEVHRAFSNRADANHRYMVEFAVLLQMVALNWLAEGDGPDLVVMCAPT